MENLNNSVSMNEIEFLTESLPTKKTPGPCSLLINSIKHLGKKNNTNPTQDVSENKGGKNTPQPTLWDQCPSKSTVDKDVTRKERRQVFLWIETKKSVIRY